jgi:hypothetical protein
MLSLGLLRSMITGAVNVLETCIDILEAFMDRFLIIETTSPVVPVSCPWSNLFLTIRNFLCPAYMLNGKGVSYTLAREVLEVRARFDQLQSQSPQDLLFRYKTYYHNKCDLVGQDDDAGDLEMTFQRLSQLNCESVETLSIQRTTNPHPVFGERSVTPGELVYAANITLYDLFGLLVKLF